MSISYIIAPSDHLQNKIESYSKWIQRGETYKAYGLSSLKMKKKSRKEKERRERGESELKRLGVTGERTTRNFTTRAITLKDTRSKFPKILAKMCIQSPHHKIKKCTNQSHSIP